MKKYTLVVIAALMVVSLLIGCTPDPEIQIEYVTKEVEVAGETITIVETVEVV